MQMNSQFWGLGSKVEQNNSDIRMIEFTFINCEKASCRKIFGNILGEVSKGFHREADFEYI